MVTGPNKKNIDATWEWIKHRLGLKGLSFGDLGRMHGTQKWSFIHVKTRPSPKYEKIIAYHVGADPWELWPDRYDENHNTRCCNPRYNKEKFYRLLGDIRNMAKLKKSMEINDGGTDHEAPK